MVGELFTLITAQDVNELDLSQNLLSRWKDVADITANLQHLRTLNLR